MFKSSVFSVFCVTVTSLMSILSESWRARRDRGNDSGRALGPAANRDPPRLPIEKGIPVLKRLLAPFFRGLIQMAGPLRQPPFPEPDFEEDLEPNPEPVEIEDEADEQEVALILAAFANQPNPGAGFQHIHVHEFQHVFQEQEQEFVFVPAAVAVYGPPVPEEAAAPDAGQPADREIDDEDEVRGRRGNDPARAGAHVRSPSSASFSSGFSVKELSSPEQSELESEVGRSSSGRESEEDKTQRRAKANVQSSSSESQVSEFSSPEQSEPEIGGSSNGRGSEDDEEPRPARVKAKVQISSESSSPEESEPEPRGSSNGSKSSEEDQDDYYGPSCSKKPRLG